MTRGIVDILPSDNTPVFLLDPNGHVRISGRCMVINDTENFRKVMGWVDNYLLNPAEITYVTICLEYLNSFCTARLVAILKKLSDAVNSKGKLVVYWYHEEDDNDILERGEYIAETFKIQIKFIKTDDIKNCC